MRNTIPSIAAMLLACATSACAKGPGGPVEDANARDAVRGTWIASALAGADGPPRIELGAREVRGHTGCNGFSGTYVRGPGGNVSFARIVSSKKFCEGEPGRSEQRVMRALSQARRATVDGDTLTLRDAAGAALLAWKRKR